MAETNSRLSEEIMIVACGGYPENEMAGQLKRLVKQFGHGEVQGAATELSGTLALVARVMETHPKEYMDRPLEEVPQELREWAANKRRRGAELKEDIQRFKCALAEVGLSSREEEDCEL